METKHYTFPANCTEDKYVQLFKQYWTEVFSQKPRLYPRMAVILTGMEGAMLLKGFRGSLGLDVEMHHIRSFDDAAIEARHIPGRDLPIPISSLSVWVVYGDQLLMTFKAEL